MKEKKKEKDQMQELTAISSENKLQRKGKIVT